MLNIDEMGDEFQITYDSIIKYLLHHKYCTVLLYIVAEECQIILRFLFWNLMNENWFFSIYVFNLIRLKMIGKTVLKIGVNDDTPCSVPNIIFEFIHTVRIFTFNYTVKTLRIFYFCPCAPFGYLYFSFYYHFEPE